MMRKLRSLDGRVPRLSGKTTQPQLKATAVK